MEEVAGASNHSTLFTLSAFSVVQASVLQGEEVCATV
jgi:hypothetical protein